MKRPRPAKPAPLKKAPHHRAVSLLGKAQEGVILLLAALTPFVFSPWHEDTFRKPKVAFLMAGLILLLVLRAAEAIERRASNAPPAVYPWWKLLPAGVLGLWCFTGFLSQVHTAVTLRLVFQTTVFIAGMGVVAERSLEKPFRQRLLRVMLGASAVMSCYGLAQYFGWDPFFVPRKTEYSGRWVVAGFIGQQTLFAAYLGLHLPLWLSEAATARRRWGRAVALGGLLTGFAAVLATESRSAMAGSVTVMVVWAILSFLAQRPGSPRRFPVLPLAGVATAVLLAGVYLTWQPALLKRMAEGVTFSGSSSYRLFYWRVGAEMAREHPLLGVGPGGYAAFNFGVAARLIEEGRTTLKPDSTYIVVQAHNEWVQVAAELGFPGLLAALWLFFAACKGAWQQVRGGDSWHGAALLSALLFLAGNAAVSFPFHLAPTVLAGGILLALGFSPRPLGEG